MLGFFPANVIKLEFTKRALKYDCYYRKYVHAQTLAFYVNFKFYQSVFAIHNTHHIFEISEDDHLAHPPLMDAGPYACSHDCC
jgi:hypothetical protein